MKTIGSTLLLILWLALCNATSAEELDRDALLGSKAKLIFTTLRVRNVSHLITFSPRVSPSANEDHFTCEYLTKSNFTGQISATSFLETLGGTPKPGFELEFIDCRWQFVVTTENGDQSVTIYANSFLTEAYTEGVAFKPSEQMREWLRVNLGTVFDANEILKADL